jgi:hypothetical protein
MVNYVVIFGDSRVEWDGFDQETNAFGLTIELTADQLPSRVTLYPEQTFDLTASSWGGSSERFSGSGTSGYIESDTGYDSSGRNPEIYCIVAAEGGNKSNADHPASDYGLSQNVADAANFEVDDDGSSESFNLKVRSTYAWYANSDGTDKNIREDVHREYQRHCR